MVVVHLVALAAVQVMTMILDLVEVQETLADIRQ
jgi:hypothetical protein